MCPRLEAILPTFSGIIRRWVWRVTSGFPRGTGPRGGRDPDLTTYSKPQMVLVPKCFHLIH